MVTRSGAGGRMPPAVGVINESVTAMRPDLRGMAGFTVRVPRSFDIATAEGPHCVWVQDPTMEFDESGEVSLPTVILADPELRAAFSLECGDCEGGEDSSAAAAADEVVKVEERAEWRACAVECV